jgi:hypothetical protein
MGEDMTAKQRFKIVKDETFCCYKIIDNTFNPEATKAIFLMTILTMRF